jgi:hypothetical protein
MASCGLWQLRVFRFSFVQDENVRVGAFPQREEIFVGVQRSGTQLGQQIPNVPACIALNQSNFESATTSIQLKNISI